MSFIRPEAREGLLRWREAMVGGAVALLGLYWFTTSFGLLKWAGMAVVVIGAAMAWSGFQRARFGGGHGGLGVVQVDERQITYLAPVGGGFASIDALTRVEIGPDLAGRPVWRFRSGGDLLTIPASAEGTAGLFDALTALPGVDISAAIRALDEKKSQSVVIWQKRSFTLH